ncbi:hypothetical protein ABE83_34510 [Streptomyces sp. CFMR 7]|nr:hypothetical protein ABE83_00025 [Streptomyces sp. CFMR 7]ALC31616.1 hypothetical protein ABE83_34510 [Streptomyces sp. CFMR 7]
MDAVTAQEPPACRLHPAADGGLAGLAAAVRFRRERWYGFLVLDRGEDIGGTWRDNTYPGATCDMPSHLYSYAFALNHSTATRHAPLPQHSPA